METNINPEDKLLRLIRNKNKVPGSPLAAALQNQKVKSGSVFRPSYAAGTRAFLIRFSQSIFSLKKINVILFFLVIAFLGYVVFELFFFREGNTKYLQTAKEAASKTETKDTLAQVSPTLDYYTSQVNKRDIFRPVLGQDQATGSAATQNEQVSNLRLAGIILDKQPQAIIEDIKLKKTYFLYRGDYIGDIKVEEILESKVILSYAGEKFELVP